MSGNQDNIIPVGGEFAPLRPPNQREYSFTTEDVASHAKRLAKSNTPSRSSRFEMLNSFVDSDMQGLPLLSGLVWLVLFRDARGDVAQTSGEYIAKRIGVKRRAVTRALKQLRDRGFVEQLKKGGLNQGASIYRIRSFGSQECLNVGL